MLILSRAVTLQQIALDPENNLCAGDSFLVFVFAAWLEIKMVVATLWPVCNRVTLISTRQTSDAPHGMQCVKIIYGYMGFSTFLIFFFMTGGILIDLAQKLKLHVDAISFTLFLYNFACVGSVILFFTAAPLSLKQVCCLTLRLPLRIFASTVLSEAARIVPVIQIRWLNGACHT
jgi:hypothetical protein